MNAPEEEQRQGATLGFRDFCCFSLCNYSSLPLLCGEVPVKLYIRSSQHIVETQVPQDWREGTGNYTSLWSFQ